MSHLQYLAWSASVLTLSANCCGSAWRARGFGVAANLMFITYAFNAGIHPVLVLHLVLLPMNAYRLCDALIKTASHRNVLGAAISAAASRFARFARVPELMVSRDDKFP